MKPLYATLVLLALFGGAGTGLASSPAAPEGAWTHVTVLLADGWRHRDVTVSLDTMGAGLWVLRDDGAERLVRLDDVGRIIGADGADITARVLAGQRAPAATTAPAVKSDGPPPADRSAPARWDGTLAEAADPAAQAAPDPRPVKLAFTVEGAWGLPCGDWFRDRTASWSAGARLRIGTFTRSYLGLGARYQDFAGVKPVDFPPAPDGAMVYELTFGWLSQRSRTGVMTYLELGGALLENRYDGHGGSGSSDSSGAFLLRGGAMLPMNDTVALDVGASAALRGLLFKPDDEQEAALLAVHVGLTWHD